MEMVSLIWTSCRKDTDFSNHISNTNQFEGSEQEQILEELLELSKEYLSAFCHIYFAFGCFQSVRWLNITFTWICYNVIMQACDWFSNPCSWVLMRWWNIYNLAPFTFFVLLNWAQRFFNSVVIFLVVPSLLSWSWQFP